MNENLNLVEILKDYPEGIKLYSPVYGDVELVEVSQDNVVPYPIKTKTKPNSTGMFSTVSFTKDGRIFAEHNGECMLFPNEEQRDWSRFENKKPKFKVGDKIVYSFGKHVGASGSYGIISEITDDKYIFVDGSYTFISNQDIWELVPDEKPKFDPKTLNPFDKVLARDEENEYWKCTFFSRIRYEKISRYKYVTTDEIYKCCIPYNDDTKHLVGTKDEAPEYYRY